MHNILAKDLDYILDNTKELWENLKNDNIFITGATGYWGCWLLESLIWANDKLNLNISIMALTRDADAFRKKAPHLANHAAVSLHVGDVRDFEIPKEQFTNIIHAATDIDKKTSSEILLDTIIRGTDHVLQLALQCKAQRFLLASSGAIYGRIPANLNHIPEDYLGEIDLTSTNGLYGLGKRIAENMSINCAKQYGLEVKIARGFTSVGPYLPLDAHFAIGNFILNGLRNEPIHIKSDGTSYRSYIYATDLTIWLWHILFRGKSCTAYNVGSDDEITIKDLAYAIAKTFDVHQKIIIDKKPKLGQFPERYVPSVKKIQQELQLVPKITLNEAIRRTKKWYLAKNS